MALTVERVAGRRRRDARVASITREKCSMVRVRLLCVALVRACCTAVFCSSLPRPTVQRVFDNPEHGDNGERLANLKAWAKGDDTIIELGTFNKE